MSNQIALVEFHDARVARVVVLSDGKAEIHFEHLSVFHFRSPVKYDVKSYSAILRVAGANSILLNQGWTFEDNLVHLEIDGRPLTKVDTPVEVSTFNGSKIGLIFASGSRIEFSFQRLSLELTTSEFLETWDGPLVHSESNSTS